MYKCGFRGGGTGGPDPPWKITSSGCPLVREMSGKFVFSSSSGKSQGIL